MRVRESLDDCSKCCMLKCELTDRQSTQQFKTCRDAACDSEKQSSMKCISLTVKFLLIHCLHTVLLFK